MEVGSMRMTDRVLNASALSSGLAVNNVSLVNQLGKNRQDSLLDALEKGSGASTGKKENYSKLRKAAEQSVLQKLLRMSL